MVVGWFAERTEGELRRDRENGALALRPCPGDRVSTVSITEWNQLRPRAVAAFTALIHGVPKVERANGIAEAPSSTVVVLSTVDGRHVVTDRRAKLHVFEDPARLRARKFTLGGAVGVKCHLGRAALRDRL